MEIKEKYNWEKKYELTQYAYKLPTDLIARTVLPYRDECRLMVLHKNTGRIEHKVFSDLVGYLNAGDILALNNSKVFKSKIYGKRIDTKLDRKVEVLLLRKMHDEKPIYECLVEPSRSVRAHYVYEFTDEPELLYGEVLDSTSNKTRIIQFRTKYLGSTVEELLDKYAAIDIKYIKQETENCQTIYGTEIGSIAPSFAGLHVSERLLKQAEVKGIATAMVTHHIGIASFHSITSGTVDKHRQDGEYYKVLEQDAAKLNGAKSICCIGISAMKAVEASASPVGIVAREGTSHAFLYKENSFTAAGSLVTNLHAPKSQYYITACAFGGRELVRDAYELAIKEKYRFLDYGDAMLII